MSVPKKPQAGLGLSDFDQWCDRGGTYLDSHHWSLSVVTHLQYLASKLNYEVGQTKILLNATFILSPQHHPGFNTNVAVWNTCMG
jgi:hypothetical protein